MTGEVFRAYVEQMLAPSLRSGDVVVMDNLPAHQVAGFREAIKAVGASLLYLPSYSPDLNPIEQLFAKLKTLLRKAAARTRDGLWTTIGTLLDAFTPTECRNYIINSASDGNAPNCCTHSPAFESTAHAPKRRHASERSNDFRNLRLAGGVL